MPKRKIVFFGNCQAQALAWLCRRFLAPRQDDQILAITAPIKDIEAARKELLGADVIVEQVFDHALEIDVAVENQGQPIICFPNVYAIFYWPYTNQRHPRNDEIDTAYDAGPYPNEMGDSFLNKLIAKGVSADDALEQYLQDDMTARADRLFELNAASQMRRDELTGCAVQQQVQEYFRDEHLFLTSAHPNMRIFSTIAEHALGQLGYPKNRIADALAAQRVSPFPHHALPIHPRVAGHFGLRFATENMRYPFFEEGDFTFAEYVRRYMNFEWSEKLRDALAVAVKNPDEALDQLEQVLPSLPRSATAVRVKSSLLLRKQDHGGALWAATQAVERDPSDPQNWIALSVAHRAAREFSPAEAALDRALDAAPMDAGVHHERAHLDAAQGLWPVAVTEAQRAVEIEPGTARFHMSLADFLTHVGRFDEAIEATQRAVALEPHVGGYRFALAHRLDRNGQGEEAAALVRDLIAKDGHDRDGYVQTGHLLARNGDLDGAEKAFRQAARLAPDDAQIELALADVLHAKGRNEEAAAVVAAVAARENRDPQVHARLGDFLSRAGDMTRAEAALRRAVELAPEIPHYRFVLAGLAERNGKVEEALAIIQGLVGEGSTDPHIFARLGYLLARQGDLAAAEAAARHAVEIAPDDAGFRVALADILDLEGDSAAAAAIVTAVAEAGLSNAHLQGRLAHFLTRMGDYRGAEAALLKLVEMLPSEAGPRRALDELRTRIELGTTSGEKVSGGATRSGKPRRPPPRRTSSAPRSGGIDSADRANKIGRLFEAIGRPLPSEIGDYIGGANALRDTGRFDEADVVLGEASARFPDNLGIAIDRAWVAHRRGDCDEAVARWAAVREALPDHHAGYTGAALTLREAGRFDDAEAILTEGMTQLPEAPEPAVDHAWLAQVRRDWPQAIARWAAVRERFGYLPVGYTAGAVALRESGQIEDAAALLVAAEAKFAEIPAPAIELAWLAIHRHDWDDAIKRWDDVRRRFPDQQAGYIGGSVALREAGRLGDAEGLLSAAQDRFPGEAGIVIEQAHLATRRRDWDAASQRWTLVRDRFPDNIAGYTGGALALREQRKFAEADTLLKQAASRFPETPEPLTELAWVAHVAHDWPEAARRWDDVRARFGGLPAGYTGGAHALREMGRYDEAESLFQQALARFPNERNILIDYAWLATARRDWPEAVQRWAIVRAGFPNAREAYLRGAQALATMWQYDEADALLAEGIARFPDDSELACEAGWLALNRKLPDEAERRFELVRTRFPDDPVGHLGAALVLRDKFELAATEALLEEACRRLPEARRLALEHAQLPMFAPLKRDRDPDEALRRLERVRERFPDYDEAYLAAIRYLRQEGRLDEADTVCAGACERLTQSPTVFTEYGAIAAERADWPEATRRYTVARDRFPDHAGGVVGLATALAATARHDEADATLREAINKFPTNSHVFAEYGRVAARREDWPEALRRWTEGQRRFPDDREFDQRIFDARLHLTESDQAADDGDPMAAETDAADDPRDAMRTLLMQFESLGGRGLGCEFGMFQREFGAEPLGLLRWADMPFEGVAFALENRFEGVGTPELTELFVNRENARPEWCTTDTRGFMFMRAFVYEDEVPRERMWKQVLRRLVFLKDKLISDLEAGEKIFVYRLTDRDLEPAEIDRLRRAVRSYGDNMLLYVRYADAAHPNGTVEIAGEGLMIGYIDRFKMARDGQLSATPPSASWMTICRNAYDLWQKQVMPRAAA